MTTATSKGNHINYDDRKALMREALAAERRATVKRIRKIALEVHHPDSWFIAQLDKEAAR